MNHRAGARAARNHERTDARRTEGEVRQPAVSPHWRGCRSRWSRRGHKAWPLGKGCVLEMERWLSRWAPLTGVVAAILLTVAFFTAGSTPNADASSASVISFFARNGSAATTSALLGAFAMIFFVLFAVAMASRLRGGGPWLANGMVAGAVFGAVGVTALFCVQYVLGENSRYLTAGSASALNLLDNTFVLPAAAGMCVFGIVGGLAVVVSGAPARWMGWVLVVIGACSASPLLFYALLVAAAWMLVTGIWLSTQALPKLREREPEADLAHV